MIKMFRFRLKEEETGSHGSKREIRYDVICLDISIYWNVSQTGYDNLLDGKRYVNMYSLYSSVFTRLSRHFDWANQMWLLFSGYGFLCGS